MLVLSRKLGERICIGNDIFVTVVEIQGNKVRLGIEAPRTMPVMRQELLNPPAAPPVQGEASQVNEAV